jgi:hypothetical protein
VTPGTGRQGDPLTTGWSSKELARWRLGDAGFVSITEGDQVVPGVQPTLRALDPHGRVWWFEVAGGRTGSRPGAQRADVLWRAIAKGAVVRSIDPSHRYGVLSCGLPAPSSGGRALGAVMGPGHPVQVVVDLLADDATATLAAAAAAISPG